MWAFLHIFEAKSNIRTKKERKIRCASTLKGGFIHAGHAGTVVLSWKTVDVDFQRNGTHRRAEIK